MSSLLTNKSVLVLLLGALTLKAGPISTIYSFGDSLSDVGNVYTATAGLIPAAPYVNGHFTNGQVWLQDLSASLGLGSVSPSLQGGHDFAFGGATSGATPFHTANPTDLTGATGQISQFQALHPVADPNALYTIWIGSNDALDILASGATGLTAAADIAAVVTNIDSAINSLSGEGAKNFLILTVPDLGVTPGVTAAGPLTQFAASSLSAALDAALVGSLASTTASNISVLNTYALLDGIVASGSTYGFTNVTSPCVTGADANYNGGTACASTLAGQDQYLFWDNLHPTEAGHALIADAALNTLAPEPATFALLGVGFFAFYLQRRKRV